MLKGKREDNIRRIISMEDRIIGCDRCKASLRCVRKPSLGKGDLEPEAVIIFESDNNYTKNINNIIDIRKTISSMWGLEKIYHTFLVRCQPKVCTLLSNTNCYGSSKLVDKDHNCILNNKQCSGIPVKPSDEQVISCLPYVVEEIEILKPTYIFLFGERVAEFMLKSWGLFNEYELPVVYHNNDSIIIMVENEEAFDSNYCSELKVLLSS